MMLNKLTKYTGELPILYSIIVISAISFTFSAYINIYYGIGMFVFGMLIVVLPNILMLKKIMSDDKIQKEST